MLPTRPSPLTRSREPDFYRIFGILHLSLVVAYVGCSLVDSIHTGGGVLTWSAIRTTASPGSQPPHGGSQDQGLAGASCALLILTPMVHILLAHPDADPHSGTYVPPGFASPYRFDSDREAETRGMSVYVQTVAYGSGSGAPAPDRDQVAVVCTFMAYAFTHARRACVVHDAARARSSTLLSIAHLHALLNPLTLSGITSHARISSNLTN